MIIIPEVSRSYGEHLKTVSNSKVSSLNVTELFKFQICARKCLGTCCNFAFDWLKVFVSGT